MGHAEKCQLGLMDGSMEPAVSLPDAGDTQTLMKNRVRDFYSRSP